MRLFKSEDQVVIQFSLPVLLSNKSTDVRLFKVSLCLGTLVPRQKAIVPKEVISNYLI